MFDFDRKRYPRTHMPFAVHDGDRLREFGCIMVDGKWKAHELVDGEWRRIATGLPDDATECSPCAWWDAISDRLTLSFVGGASLTSLPYRLYAGEEGDFHEVTYASVGLVHKGMVVHGDGSNEFDIETEGMRRHVTLSGVSYVYRLSLDENAPTRLLATCMMENEDIRTYALDIMRDTCHELIADGHSPYKACLCDGLCAYAVKCGEDWEDREIRVTDDWWLERADGVAQMTEEQVAEED